MKVRAILFALALVAPTGWASTPETQAVEFFNTDLGHYFLTADAAEALSVDAGAAGDGWVRTGRTFGALALGGTRIGFARIVKYAGMALTVVRFVRGFLGRRRSRRRR